MSCPFRAVNGTACPTWLLTLLYKLQAIVDVLQRQVAALHGPQCCIFLQAFKEFRHCHNHISAIATQTCGPAASVVLQRCGIQSKCMPGRRAMCLVKAHPGNM